MKSEGWFFVKMKFIKKVNSQQKTDLLSNKKKESIEKWKRVFLVVLQKKSVIYKKEKHRKKN